MRAAVELAEANHETELLCIALSNVAVVCMRLYQFQDAEIKARNAIEIAKTLFPLSSRKVNSVYFFLYCYSISTISLLLTGSTTRGSTLCHIYQKRGV